MKQWLVGWCVLDVGEWTAAAMSYFGSWRPFCSNFNGNANFVASQDGTDSSLSIPLCIRSKNSMTAIVSHPKSTTSCSNVSFLPIALTQQLAQVLCIWVWNVLTSAIHPISNLQSPLFRHRTISLSPTTTSVWCCSPHQPRYYHSDKKGLQLSLWQGRRDPSWIGGRGAPCARECLKISIHTNDIWGYVTHMWKPDHSHCTGLKWIIILMTRRGIS